MRWSKLLPNAAREYLVSGMLSLYSTPALLQYGDLVPLPFSIPDYDSRYEHLIAMLT